MTRLLNLLIEMAADLKIEAIQIKITTVGGKLCYSSDNRHSDELPCTPEIVATMYQYV
jgi:hypothetical protein